MILLVVGPRFNKFPAYERVVLKDSEFDLVLNCHSVVQHIRLVFLTISFSILSFSLQNSSTLFSKTINFYMAESSVQHFNTFRMMIVCMLSVHGLLSFRYFYSVLISNDDWTSYCCLTVKCFVDSSRIHSTTCHLRSACRCGSRQTHQ